MEAAAGGMAGSLKSESCVNRASISSDEDGENCPICLNTFRDQAVGTPESCSHYFCLDCIVEWSKVSWLAAFGASAPLLWSGCSAAVRAKPQNVAVGFRQLFLTALGHCSVGQIHGCEGRICFPPRCVLVSSSCNVKSKRVSEHLKHFFFRLGRQ